MASVVYRLYTHPNAVAGAVGVVLLIRLGYSWLWPKPIPTIPHNPITSIWGDIPAIAKANKKDKVSFVEFLGDMVKTHGPISQVLIGPQVMVIVSDIRETERILIEGKITDQHKRMNQVFETVIPNSQIALPTNETWKKHRRLTGPSMSRRYLERMSVRIVAGANNLVRLWSAKVDIVGSRAFEAGLDVQLATMDTIVDITMGHPLGCIDSGLASLLAEQIQKPTDTDIAYFSRPELPPLHKAIVEMIQSLDRVCKVPFPMLYARIFKYGSPSWRKEYNSITTFLNNAIAEAQQRRDTTEKENGLSSDADCVLDMLVQHEAGEGAEKFGKAEIQDELLMYLFAGQDTTASAIKWMLKYLPKNAEVQRRLHEEMCSVFGQDKNGGELMDFKLLDDPERVPMLEAVVAETLRCAGVGSLISRALLQDEVILGKIVPKGTLLAFATALMSRSESEWGPDANEWRPTRWLTPSGTFNRSAGPSFPFGLGQRSCFGQRLGLLQLKAFVAAMSRAFFFNSVPQEIDSWEAIEAITKQPKVCYISLERWDSTSKESQTKDY
ncbi:Cytochrome P450 4V2 [Rhizoctonia solani]|uniref:Cytochrome P450 4V2 n=1 Tax=Rhizoctonia solani TaxID=456999 RepID=A0A0K6GED9_9AGAM|nr:Cytochrome P450 4V2 [Rhizoctonia solani]